MPSWLIATEIVTPIRLRTTDRKDTWKLEVRSWLVRLPDFKSGVGR